MEIEFGEVEQTPPARQMRPDRNLHFAVEPCGAPEEGELPIFVDIDVMRDIERHAVSDTSVELGGVLLGGQYMDEDGFPFVLVSDSLRAEHYENSKGSFKFTHETWQSIARQREQFPDDVQMVGWYHTHPDWGVFLSGMDMFICDNFFNRPLDVALVVDPCRGDRGWFQWTEPMHGGRGAERIRRTGGFYLTASRFRASELTQFAAQLENETMARNQRFAGEFGPASGPVPQVIQFGDSRSAWPGVALAGMMTMQFLVVALIAWKVLLTGDGGPNADSTAAARDALAARANRLAIERQVLDDVLSRLDDTPDGFVESLTESARENDELRMDKEAQLARVRELERTVAQLDNDREQLAGDVERWREAHGKIKEQTREQAAKIDELAARIGTLTGVDEDANDGDKASSAGQYGVRRSWWIAGAVAAVVLLVAGIGGVMMNERRRREEEEAADAEYSDRRSDPRNSDRRELRTDDSSGDRFDERSSNSADSDAEDDATRRGRSDSPHDRAGNHTAGQHPSSDRGRARSAGKSDGGAPVDITITDSADDATGDKR